MGRLLLRVRIDLCLYRHSRSLRRNGQIALPSLYTEFYGKLVRPGSSRRIRKAGKYFGELLK